ncbi:MAG: hypothetical protein UV70_C0011G0084 [Parcubacteria group bacterium GW2011_GWA2_43_13]|nr:MAG: hypothetical protein UV70_C0011G0084 [Parcubacteria group bacterium GW2011_GWA2_43_13]OGY71442.1 MAG: hypothetical protein A2986_03810 [Candidatus Jacksonbacteria bacterium RIFCSPLOWO2_01_FULL_44_13]HAZ16636.1 hypothetical protein [Candidatus Jacksonbacteria bacterium]
MKLQYTFYFAFRMFQTSKLRTFLTVLGISIGIGTILFLVSLGYGLQSLLLERIASKNALLSIDIKSKEDVLLINDEVLQRIRDIKDIEDVIPVTATKGLIRLDDVQGGTNVNIVDPSYFQYFPTKPQKGEYISATGEGKTNGVIVSEAVLRLFNLSISDVFNEKGEPIKEIEVVLFWEDTENTTAEDENIEQTIQSSNIVPQILEQKFFIVGVMREPVVTYMYIARQDVPNIPITTYSEAKVKAATDEARETARNSALEMGFEVAAIVDTLVQTTRIFRIIQITLGVFGLVALVVSAIGMFNTMTIALLERTREIGIIKSIGARRKDVANLFLIESGMLGILGGLGGILFGYLMGVIFNLGLNILASFLGGQSLELFERPLWFIATIFVFSGIVGFVTGIYPAIRASKLNALEALQYK